MLQLREGRSKNSNSSLATARLFSWFTTKRSLSVTYRVTDAMIRSALRCDFANTAKSSRSHRGHRPKVGRLTTDIQQTYVDAMKQVETKPATARTDFIDLLNQFGDVNDDEADPITCLEVTRHQLERLNVSLPDSEPPQE